MFRRDFSLLPEQPLLTEETDHPALSSEDKQESFGGPCPSLPTIPGVAPSKRRLPEKRQRNAGESWAEKAGKGKQRGP